MRMTTKGQVTIPKQLREKLGLQPGDDVGFREDGQDVILENASKQSESDFLPGETRGERLVRGLQEFGERMRREGLVDARYAHMTTDEIMEELRGYSQDANDPGFQRHS